MSSHGFPKLSNSVEQIEPNRTKCPITWRISGRAEISTRPTRMNFVAITRRTSARTESIGLGAKYEIAREESPENQNGAENTTRENRRIASLAVTSIGGAQFSTFWAVTANKMMELKRDLTLAA